MNKIVALGFFDGVHLGHQALLKECCRLAREQNAEACAITFAQHPQSLFTDNPPRLINGLESRTHLMKYYGIQRVMAYPVTRKVMSMSWQDFLDELAAAGAVGFVCGNDFRFGNRGEGNAEKLKTYCQERKLLCSIEEDQMLDGVRVSSTHIRSLLEEGNLEEAIRFMGHPHVLVGTVVSGRKIGHTIGTPTANINLPEAAAELPHGVYACKAVADGKEYLAVTNIGSRPTVGGHQVRAETSLLDFDGDLYGKELLLQFYKFLRPERKFDSLEELREEIQKNIRQTRDFFEKR